MYQSTKNTQPTPRQPAPARSLHHPALSPSDRRLARIRSKAPQERTNAELAFEEAADLAVAFPDERASIIAGALHGLSSMQCGFVLIAGLDEQDRFCWASAVVDFEGYFAGAS